jgi:Rha family phage regulatory protein
MNNNIIKLDNLDIGFDWTSLQIAEWIGKEHFNVIRDIEDEINKLGEIGKLIFEVSSYKLDSNTRTYKMYKLTYKGILQIAARYDAKVRYKLIEIVDKSRNQQKALPRNYKEALICLVEAEEEKEKLQIERNSAIRTKGQISRKREASVMGQLSQMKRRYNKLTENEKRDGEYTATEIAIKCGVYSENGNPHSQMVGAFLNDLTDKKSYVRTVKVLLDNDKVVDCNYYNKLFLEKFIDFMNKRKNDILNLNGRNYKFDKL